MLLLINVLNNGGKKILNFYRDQTKISNYFEGLNIILVVFI